MRIGVSPMTIWYGTPCVAKVVQQHEQRQIRAEDGLVDPLLAVRPAARAAAVRQMRMQRENEGAHRYLLSRKAPCPSQPAPPRAPRRAAAVL